MELIALCVILVAGYHVITDPIKDSLHWKNKSKEMMLDDSVKLSTLDNKIYRLTGRLEPSIV